jgi:hypothetical protein
MLRRLAGYRQVSRKPFIAHEISNPHQGAGTRHLLLPNRLLPRSKAGVTRLPGRRRVAKLNEYCSLTVQSTFSSCMAVSQATTVRVSLPPKPPWHSPRSPSSSQAAILRLIARICRPMLWSWESPSVSIRCWLRSLTFWPSERRVGLRSRLDRSKLLIYVNKKPAEGVCGFRDFRLFACSGGEPERAAGSMSHDTLDNVLDGTLMECERLRTISFSR